MVEANDELKQIATQKGVTLPAAVEGSQMRDMQRLEKLQATAFDREYMKHMVADHKKDISAIEKQVRSSDRARMPI